MLKEKSCKNCGKIFIPLISNRQVHCSRKCVKTFYNKKIVRKVTLKRRNRKNKLKEGLSCFMCGYNQFTEILQFHHLGEKKYNMSHIRTKKAWEEEIRKCVPLCPNCHFLLYHRQNILKSEYN